MNNIHIIEKIKDIIRRKHSTILILSLVYLVLVGFLKWAIYPPVDALWYLAGGLMGIYFLDVAEVFFHLAPSPFRSVLFVAAFAVVALFIVTSSGSLFASGVVLSVFLTLVFWQIGEWHIVGNLNSWYRMIAGPVSITTQRRILIVTVVIFIVLSMYFIRA